MAPTVIDPKTANIWTARIIPLILIGIVGYVTWVFVVLVCVEYLLRTAGTDRSSRLGTATALIAVYSILLLLIAFAYFRLLYTVARDPGFVPRGPRWRTNRKGRRKVKQDTADGIKLHKHVEDQANGQARQVHERDGGFAYPDGPPMHEDMEDQRTSSNSEEFYTKDLFSCEGDGKPIWCSTCLNFKPDRAHHCREVGRCVRKMDHFCPWVGGIVSETSFKFFLQFTIWASVYWMFNLIAMAILVAELKKENDELNVHWIINLALGGFFGLFTIGMTMSSMQFVLLNTTTIENLSRHSKVWTLAVRIPRSVVLELPTPLPFYSVAPSMSSASSDATPSAEKSTFAVLHSKPGENPWDLGPFRNFKSVMGDHWYDWLLPLRYSPCCDHHKFEAQFETGPVVQRMKEEAGLVPPPIRYESEKPERRHRKERRRRRHKEMNGKNQTADPDNRHSAPGHRSNSAGEESVEGNVR